MTVTLDLTRRVALPAPLTLARHRKVPELGPRMLFFSGGTALRELSRRLIEYTHNSVHLITPFDSGGSSAELRRAFRMPAVGDLRNRLLALADQTVHGQPEIFALFVYRFPTDAGQPELRRRLRRMVDGKDPRVAAVPDPMRKIIRSHLRFFREAMPERFDLRGANVGNLILTGGYLSQNRHIDPVIFLFSRLVVARGLVRPIATRHLQLAAELADGTRLVGQHRLTGKEVAPLDSPIRRLWLARSARRPAPVRLALREKVARQIRSADLVCYPPGSFYSSLVANLLVHGVGQAVAETPAPKVYVPNTGADPEQVGLSLVGAVRALLKYLRAGCERRVRTADLLQYVLVDARRGPWRARDLAAVERLGVQVVDLPLISTASAPLIDSARLVDILISLA